MKKISSIFLAIILTISVLLAIPVQVSAATTTYYKNGDVLRFGSYPQSAVTDEAVIEQLNELEFSWNSFDWYAGDDSGSAVPHADYGYYADVEFNGAKYRAVRIEHFRLDSTTGSEDYYDGYYNPDGIPYQMFDINYPQHYNGYEQGINYWFKYEPIEWIVLDRNNGTVISKSILDSQAFHNGYYFQSETMEIFGDAQYLHFASNWEHSSIRAWLNDDFLNTAFSVVEQQQIKQSNIQTRSSGGSGSNYTSTVASIYDSSDTVDKIYLLSSSEANALSSDQRSCMVSDYARVNGLNTDASFYGLTWRVRNACERCSQASVVDDSNRIVTHHGNYIDGGIRAVCSLSSDAFVCKYCGQYHSNAFIRFIHSILYFFAHLFGKM